MEKNLTRTQKKSKKSPRKLQASAKFSCWRCGKMHRDLSKCKKEYVGGSLL